MNDNLSYDTYRPSLINYLPLIVNR